MTGAKSDNVVMLHRENVGNRLNFFDKTFAEYEEGFEANGKFSSKWTILSIYPGEVWIGLKKLYQVTSEAEYRLNITMVDFDGATYHAVYDQFKVRLR